MFGFNFAPKGWATCNGQLPLSQNTALFSLLGTTYGGDGKSTFALPNLQGNIAMNQGQGSGLTDRILGEISGTENVTLLLSEIPSHAHGLGVHTADLADTNVPSPNASYATATGGKPFQATPNVQMAPLALTPTGGNLPHNNLQPYLVVNFCIAMQGVFPPRP